MPQSERKSRVMWCRSLSSRRSTRHPGYKLSQVIRKRVEEIFGWTKGPGGQHKTRFRGRERVEASFSLALTASNLFRLPRLLAALPP